MEQAFWIRKRPKESAMDVFVVEEFALEAIKRLAPPPVVAVLTNYPHEQYRARCAALGADYFFDKAARASTRCWR